MLIQIELHLVKKIATKRYLSCLTLEDKTSKGRQVKKISCKYFFNQKKTTYMFTI
jgi:hypothetical protein